MTGRDDRLLIVTGLSGSGKTAAGRFLEDLGYFCVDNLPAKLIPIFVDLWRQGRVALDRAALVVDMREPGFLADFPAIWDSIRRTSEPWLVFLDASDETLVQRFSESRRPHPLSRHRPALAGVRLERRRLAPIKALADEVIDTSALSIANLREEFARRFSRAKRPALRVQLTSFGYKYGIPMDADLLFDTRFLPNPFYQDDLRDKPGTHKRVREFVLRQPETKAFLAELGRFVGFLMPRFTAEGKSQLVIAVGCTGGRHRSVVVAEALADTLRGRKYDIKMVHRDVDK
jgi:UPF0042 nucleotide-binding protein